MQEDGLPEDSPVNRTLPHYSLAKTVIREQHINDIFRALCQENYSLALTKLQQMLPLTRSLGGFVVETVFSICRSLSEYNETCHRILEQLFATDPKRRVIILCEINMYLHRTGRIQQAFDGLTDYIVNRPFKEEPFLHGLYGRLAADLTPLREFKLETSSPFAYCNEHGIPKLDEFNAIETGLLTKAIASFEQYFKLGREKVSILHDVFYTGQYQVFVNYYLMLLLIYSLTDDIHLFLASELALRGNLLFLHEYLWAFLCCFPPDSVAEAKFQCGHALLKANPATQIEGLFSFVFEHYLVMIQESQYKSSLLGELFVLTLDRICSIDPSQSIDEYFQYLYYVMRELMDGEDSETSPLNDPVTRDRLRHLMKSGLGANGKWFNSCQLAIDSLNMI